MALTSRAVCITWLAATVGNIGHDQLEWVIFVSIFLIRFFAVITFHKRERESLYNKFVCALSLCISDSAWIKNSESPWQSRNVFVTLSLITTIENIGSLFIAAYYEKVGKRFFVGFFVIILRINGTLISC